MISHVGGFFKEYFPCQRVFLQPGAGSFFALLHSGHVNSLDAD